MSLYGALYASVSGLRSQGSKIAIISDNISNVNTVGYKQGSAQFQTLVTNTSIDAAYSPGGVLARTRQLVDKQGLINSTDAPTDIALSGNGFFVVQGSTAEDSEPLYTRAGSFRQDSLGNFQNANGFYLLGWPLDRNGLLPGEPGNTNTTSFADLSSLKLVNVSSASGVASATSSIAIGANLSASQNVYPGKGLTAAFDPNSINANNLASSIIIPAERGITTSSVPSNIQRGDTFEVVGGISPTNSTGTTTTFVYGGFTIGRNVTTQTSNTGDGGLGLNYTPASLTSITTNAASSSRMDVVSAAAHGYSTGDWIYIAGVTGTTSGITAAQINGWRQITVDSSTTYHFSADANASAGGAAASGTKTSSNNVLPDGTAFASGAGIFDASTSAEKFFNDITGYSVPSLTFTVTTSKGTSTFKYVTAAPNALNGEFNSLDTLANALNTDPNLTARVFSGRLYVGAEDASDSVTIANTDAAGADGINWTRALDIADISAAATGVNRFSTLQGLSNKANDASGVSGTITNPLSIDASLTLQVDDPQATLQFNDGSGNAGSLLAELAFKGSGITPVISGTASPSSIPSTGVLDAQYSSSPASGSTSKNMASGGITPQFSRNVRIFDSQGTGHDLRMSFLKVATNTWAVEVHSIPTGDVAVPGRTDGQVAAGTVVFNGDGTLQSVPASLSGAVDITWNPSLFGASASSVLLDFGTAGIPPVGKADGLSQFDANYNVSFINQNGSAPGNLTRVTIDQDGFVLASYSNGDIQKIYKLPIADFNNPNGLNSITGNVYSQSGQSGVVNLRQAGAGSAGKIVPSALEASNVDLGEQLTDMIVAQRAYQANTKVIKTTDELLQELSQL